MESLPTIQDLTSDKETSWNQDVLNKLLSNQPKQDWVKTHPFIKNWKYLPIGRVENLLKKVFKEVNIEILRENTAFNAVYVVIRLHYKNPITNEMKFQDGIGACQLQTKQGTSPSDLININNGAVSMAFPIAESYAIKDAAEKLGDLFGASLNRKDEINYNLDKEPTKKELIPFTAKWEEAKKQLLAGKTISDIEKIFEISEENKIKLYDESI